MSIIEKRIASENAAVLAEIEDALRAMPTNLWEETQEVFSWLGRATTAVARWDAAAGKRARECVQKMQTTRGPGANPQQGYLGLMFVLHEARSDLRFDTLGPVNTAIGQGLVFDYFDEIRKQIELANTDLLFVDPYLDADFVARYLPHVRSGVSVRVLSRKGLATLIPAVKLFAQQQGMDIKLRSTPSLHDRYLLVDGKSCYQSGASFKDGGRNSPTTITEITDAFVAVRDTYEDMWNNGKIEV